MTPTKHLFNLASRSRVGRFHLDFYCCNQPVTPVIAISAEFGGW